MKHETYPYTNGHSTELATVPRSLRERLEQVQALVSQGRPAEAETQLRAAETELARSRPDLYMILQAIRHGYRGIQFEDAEYNTYMQRVEKRWWGILVGEDWVPHTTTRRTVKRISFF
ncbi:MAG: hypothetical protein JSS66_08440 [Armatimonadetes bacterium]|nr:hypothetical protein [Armatimonadota bacterium]